MHVVRGGMMKRSVIDAGTGGKSTKNAMKIAPLVTRNRVAVNACVPELEAKAPKVLQKEGRGAKKKKQKKR
jgi:hypothetical protein